MEVGALDIFFNCTMSKTQLMHKNIPWKEARGEYLESLQFLIKILTKPEDDIVLMLMHLEVRNNFFFVNFRI